MTGQDLSAEGIRAARQSRGWTQKELGRRLGVTDLAVRYYENGLRKPAPYLRDKLAAILYGADPATLEAIESEIERVSSRLSQFSPADRAVIMQAVERGLETAALSSV